MYSIILSDGTDPSIQAVYWTILAIFLVLTILSWFVASADWFKEETSSDENLNEQLTTENTEKNS